MGWRTIKNTTKHKNAHYDKTSVQQKDRQKFKIHAWGKEKHTWLCGKTVLNTYSNKKELHTKPFLFQVQWYSATKKALRLH